MLLIETEDFSEADGAIFEAPVPCTLLAVAKVVNENCGEDMHSELTKCLSF